MTNIFESAFVIARRDFVATVYSRSFIFFLLAPLLVFGFVIGAGLATDEADRIAAQPVVAVVADSATQEALASARSRLVAGTFDQVFPILRSVAPAENVDVQARRLLADDEAGYSAVFSGTIDRPVLTGPDKIDDRVGKRINLLVEEARRTAALEAAGVQLPARAAQRIVTEQAAGNLRSIRRAIAQSGQMLIFMVTLMLATLLLSNLVEEKSNKVIEVLAAAVPLDAVFLGKLIAMLGISLVGLAVWGGMAGLAYFFVQAAQDWMTTPQVGPAIGWPAYVVLVLLYYSTNYMLLGSLFLGIGGQASNIREIQTLSMPITLLQLMMLLLAMTAVGSDGGTLTWLAYLFPFSSPLAMIALAAESDRIWPHLLALVWQALWIVIIIRISARMFRSTVLKSTTGGGFFDFLRRPRKSA
ncbi:MAG TPA: ABC transporter permease [Allosphingosinicella sp.]|nr:ABC transporter permease [Allosphingosinicella sp.]